MSIYSVIDLLLSFYLIAQSNLGFPTGCLRDDKNFEQACQSLRKIKSSDTLVFSTGEKMKGCFLLTKSNEDQNLIDMSYVARVNLVNFLRSKGVTNKNFIETVMRNPDFILTDNKFIKSLSSSEATTVKGLLESLRSIEHFYKPKTEKIPVDLSAELETAKIKILDNFRSQNMPPPTFAYFENAVKKIKLNSPQEKLDACRPNFDAFNDTRSNKVGFEGSINQYPYASRIFIFGHELAHSVDPCIFVARSNLSFDKHPNLDAIQCLREEVGHFSRYPGPMNKYREKFCEDNHTRETFCDLHGTALLADHIKNQSASSLKKSPPQLGPGEVLIPEGYENIIGMLDISCGVNTDPKTHPATKRRITEIVLRNPTIAKQMNCPTNDTYCDLKLGVINKNSASKPNQTGQQNAAGK